jgi:hypothetical protein
MPDSDDTATYQFPGFGELLDVPPERLPEMARCLAAHIFILQCIEDQVGDVLCEEEAQKLQEKLRSTGSTWADNERYEFEMEVGGEETIQVPYRTIMRALFPSLPLVEAANEAVDVLRGSAPASRAEPAADQLEEAVAAWAQPGSNLPESIPTTGDE